MNFLLVLVLTLGFRDFSYCIDCDSNDSNEESLIKRELLCKGYDSAVRPVSNHKTTTTIRVKMMVKSYDFSDHASTLTVNTWTVTKWNDEFLRWDPMKYNNIKSVDVPSSQIWRPDLALYNADISYGIGSCHETSCLIESNGNISCIEPCSYVGHCQTDFSLWPFDKQNCSMVFGPWMNNEDEIDYVTEQTVITTSGSAEHTQWKLISASVRKKVFSIQTKDKKYVTKFPNLIYNFIIERHSSLISKIVHSSCILMICINVLAIFVNIETLERIALIATNIYLHFQVIHQISWMLPHGGGTVPYTLTFYRNSLIVTCLLLLETLLVRTIASSERASPDYVKNFILLIRRNHLGFLFFGRMEDKENQDENMLIDGKEITSSSNNKLWRDFSFVLDKILVFTIVIFYVITCLTLIPRNYAANSDPIQEIS